MKEDIKPPIAVDLALLFVCISWATTHSFIRILYEHMTPFGMTATRFIMMMLIAIAILLFTRERVERRDFKRLLLVAMLSHGLYQFPYVLSIEFAGAFTSGVLLSMVPVFTLVIGSLTKIEKPTREQVIGVSMAVICAIAFVVVTRTPSGTPFGGLLALLAALLFAGYGVAVKPLTAKYSPWTLISWQAIIGGIPLVVAGLPDLAAQDWSRVTPTDWLLLVNLAVLPAFVGYAAWNWGILHVGAARTSAYALLVPVLASVVSLVTLHEPWSAASLVFAAGLIISLGVTRMQPSQDRAAESRN